MIRIPNSQISAEIAQELLDEAVQLLIQQLPRIQLLATELIDTILAPKVVARQLVLVLALETGLVTYKQVTSLLQALVSHFSSRSRLLRKLRQEQMESATQDEWMELAERMDQIQGHDQWRNEPTCALYERERISAQIDELVHLLRRHDLFELLFVLRGSLGRNQFGLLHEGLFTKALAGTKVLVETYHQVVCAALDFVCDAAVRPDQPPIPTEARLAFFNETRHSYGRTALILSGGAALGFYHVGVVRTLMENRLMPRVMGGSSAGSLVCAMIATRTDEECYNDLFQVRGTTASGHSGQLKLDFFRPITGRQPQQQQMQERTRGTWLDFYYNTAGAFHDMKLTVIGFMPIPLRHFASIVYDLVTGGRRPQDVFKRDTQHFRECVRANIGNFTFQEAFDRTGRILNIVVTPNNSSDPPRLLNYLTAPHVLVWSAAVASCSLPGVFEANRLVVKEADGWERYESDGGQRFSDGSMEVDLPTQQLSEMFNVNHFIISQANPHAVMFASYNNKIAVWTTPLLGALESILVFLRNQVRSWLLHLVESVGARRIAPLFDTSRGLYASVFTQEYEGRSIDISLIPWLGHRSLLSAIFHTIYNPGEIEFREWVEAAARETWKYIPAIKSHISEEVTLDRCVQRLRKRMIKESYMKRDNGTTSLNERVPSFFHSPSLINFGGLTVSDQQTIERIPTKDQSSSSQVIGIDAEPPHAPTPPLPSGVVHNIEIGPGWGGMGLQGNRVSSGSLHRTSSDASGLFYEEDAVAPLPQQQQHAGEDPTPAPSEGGYVKTSSMASFYYRRPPSFESAEHLLSKTHTSDSHLSQRDTGSSQSTLLSTYQPNERRRSKSHADLFVG